MVAVANDGAARQSKYAAKKYNSYKKDENDAQHEYRGHFKPKRDMSALAERFSDHTVRLASLVKNNSEIRRFTALGILNYLLQKGEISGESRYVQFKWDKFGVKSDGIMREYRYTEPFFLNALVASFTSFASSAQSVIDKFCVIELNQNLDKAVDMDKVNEIIESNKDIKSDVPFDEPSKDE